MKSGTLTTTAGLVLLTLVTLAGLSGPVMFFGLTVFMGLGNGIALPSSNAGILSVRPDLSPTELRRLLIAPERLAAAAEGVSLELEPPEAHYLGRVLRTRIGSPFVIAAMEESGGRVVGYEPNGGFLLGFRFGWHRLSPACPRIRHCPLPVNDRAAVGMQHLTRHIAAVVACQEQRCLCEFLR